MNEERLLDGGASELEAALLKSGATESPSAELSAKMMAPVAGAGAAATTATGSTLAKWAGGLLTGALVAGGIAYSLESTDPTESIPREEAANPTTEAAMPLPPKKTEAPDEARDVSVEEKPQTRTPEQVKVQPPQAMNSSPSQLSQEMKLLDQARSAVKKGDSDRALILLNSYARKFPKGRLKEEATVLRVKALKGTGDSEKASELKKEFLRTHPQSAHKKRLQQGEDSAR